MAEEIDGLKNEYLKNAGSREHVPLEYCSEPFDEFIAGLDEASKEVVTRYEQQVQSDRGCKELEQ